MGEKVREQLEAVTQKIWVVLTRDLREAWRYTGPFTRWNRFKGTFPGLGIATVAFAVYCGYEYMFLQDDHHHAEGHGEAHH